MFTQLTNKYIKPSKFLSLPNETKPAFADRACSGASFSSLGGEEDHKQAGALLSPAVRLASTNSCKTYIIV